jgi:hypothetical protein
LALRLADAKVRRSTFAGVIAMNNQTTATAHEYRVPHSVPPARTADAEGIDMWEEDLDCVLPSRDATRHAFGPIGSLVMLAVSIAIMYPFFR